MNALVPITIITVDSNPTIKVIQMEWDTNVAENLLKLRKLKKIQN